MRTTYRVLAYLIAVGVAVQAATIAYVLFGLGRWIQDGGVLDKATMESEGAGFDGVIGFAIHGINGEMVIPALALILLVVSFFAKVPRGVMWAGVIVGLIIVQVALGIVSSAVPGLGLLHGLNALLLFAAAIAATRLKDTGRHRREAAEPSSDRTSAV
ncbi:MAG: hypothetical protein QOF00_3390 [Pseudonocardiales bacterium]|jgi:hypothetical protein|nr:hypothetical protein [Pseudonocardiales bacterium]